MKELALKYKYTEKEIKELLSSIVMIVDTREQENKHILEYFASKEIPYQEKKLDYGDTRPICQKMKS